MYSEDVIRRVRDSINVYDLISGYVALKKTGKNWLGLCPFHSEKTPSFNVNTEKQIFHCFGCGVGGDVFKFVELQEGLNFPEAIKTLAARSGITLPQDTRDHRQDKGPRTRKRRSSRSSPRPQSTSKKSWKAPPEAQRGSISGSAA